MATRLSLDDKLAALRKLRGQTLTPEQTAELKKCVGDRSNLVVAASAALAGENMLVELSRDLEAAFERFLVNPAKDDKLCRAKIAVVQALDKMEHQDPDVFQKAARHVQYEPVWGGSEDSAPPCVPPPSSPWRGSRARGAAPPGRRDDRRGQGRAHRRGDGDGCPRDRGRGPAPPPQGPHRRQGPRSPFRVPLRSAGGRSEGVPSVRLRVPRASERRGLRGGGPRAGEVAPPRRGGTARDVLAALSLLGGRAAGPPGHRHAPPTHRHRLPAGSRRVRFGAGPRSRRCRPSRSTITTRASANGWRRSFTRPAAPGFERCSSVTSVRTHSRSSPGFSPSSEKWESSSFEMAEFLRSAGLRKKPGIS